MYIQLTEKNKLHFLKTVFHMTFLKLHVLLWFEKVFIICVYFLKS